MTHLDQVELTRSDEELFAETIPSRLSAPVKKHPDPLSVPKTLPSEVHAPKGKRSSKPDRWSAEAVRDELQRMTVDPLDLLDRAVAIDNLAQTSGWDKRHLERALKGLQKKRKPSELTISNVEPASEQTKSRVESLAIGDILSAFHADLRALGYVADRNLSDSLIISQVARLLPRSTGFIFHGLSGSGKTDGILKAAEMLPPEIVVNLTALTERAFFYIGDLKGKYLILGEVAPAKQGDDDPRQMAWRQLISENRLTLQSVERDDEGKNSAITHVTEGPCVIVAATTTEQSAWCDEFVNRQSWVRTDDSEKATDAVCKLIADRASRPWEIASTELIVDKWRYFHRALKPYPVAIPFAHLIRPGLAHVSARRLFGLILLYTSCSALLHQHQRAIERHGDLEYVIAEIKDYEIAFNLLSGNAPRPLDVVSKAAARAFDVMKEKLEQTAMTTGEIVCIIGQPKTTVQRWLNELTEAGLVTQDGKVCKSNLYKLGAGRPASQDLGLVQPDRILCVDSNQSAETLTDDLGLNAIFEAGEV